MRAAAPGAAAASSTSGELQLPQAAPHAGPAAGARPHAAAGAVRRSESGRGEQHKRTSGERAAGPAGGGGGTPEQQAAADALHAGDIDEPRIIRPHISRPPVSRSWLQHAAKALGIHLQGDVATNEISTAKYTIVTFLPVNLFEQFMRVANLYFLLCAILQLIPGLSPTSWFTTVAPLVFVLAVNAIKEGYDDACRHRNDSQINNRRVLMLDAEQGEVSVFWKDVVAGDLIKVMEDEEVPADLVLLSAPDPENLCYVETANLDGETNLKIKYCWAPGVTGRSEAAQFRGLCETCFVGCEQPNPKLYVFDGFMSVNGAKEPLDTNNLLLRGSTLRKTGWAIGVAVNVGRDAKIVQNMTKAPRKVTQLERNMNVLVIIQFMVLFIVSAVLAGLSQWWELNHAPSGSGKGHNRSWYLRSTGTWPELPPGGLGWFISLLRFIILLGNLIPISLYVTLEVVKVFQCALLLNPDRQMYHRGSDTPFVCRTTRLNEELGQVQYVLSDKTGTLTQNVMGWVWASVGGHLYGRTVSSANSRPTVPPDTPHTIALDGDTMDALGLREGDRGPDPAVDAFMINLAVCNTVVPSVNADGEVQYQASSPDEEALVEGAAMLGYRLTSRTTEAVTIEHGGKVWTYDVLAVLEFNSDRKRMSLIVRQRWDGRIVLFCKGADSIMLERDAPGQAVRARIEEHLGEMSRAGLRTLVIAQRELSEDDYQRWNTDFEAASVALENREGRVADVSDRIERDLDLVGATAVEDKLQDGVPECLQALAAAGIKIWVLTGDKVETAISIAYSCRLFTEDMGILTLREADMRGAPGAPGALQCAKASRPDLQDLEKAAKVLSEKLQEIRHANESLGAPEGTSRVGIVIEGGALAAALEAPNQRAFMDMCSECRAVVCCRVSPMQKAQVTNLVKKLAGAITLGIGDGANDVGMIRAAHIGVGISGREGRAAVLSSDFSFAQFKYLSRLLLLHGRWCYLRNQEVVLYSFYKNWAYTLVFVYLQFLAGFSSVPIFTTMLISTFNMIFTACPIVCYAVVEQDLNPATIVGDMKSIGNPETYSLTRKTGKREFFSHFATYMAYGAWHSLVIFFVPFYALASSSAVNRNAASGDLFAAGTAVFVALIVTVTLKLSTRTRAWNWITFLVYGLSLALLLPFIYVLGFLWPKTGILAVSDMTGVAAELFAYPAFWLAAVLLAPGLSLLPDLAIAGFSRYLRPSLLTLLQESEKLAAFHDKLQAAAAAENGHSGGGYVPGMGLGHQSPSPRGKAGGGGGGMSGAGDAELAMVPRRSSANSVGSGGGRRSGMGGGAGGGARGGWNALPGVVAA